MSALFAIVPAQPSHAEAIARLSHELGYPMSGEATRAALERMAKLPTHRVVVAAAPDGRLLGWASVERRLCLESGEFVELTGLVVAAGARHSGIGRALVTSAEAWALGNGFSSIRVRSNVARTESHPFYERLGFARTKTQHVYGKTLARSA